MKITAEVAGKTADRFRAYSAEKLTRKLGVEDHTERAKLGKKPAKRNARIQYDGEQVAVEGPVTGSTVSISTPEGKTITRVAFYKGPVEEEVAVGMCEPNTTESVEVELVEPSSASEDEIEILKD